MPRTRQGGARGGSPGTAYPNRTDIGSQPNLPARVATGQTYGKGQAQLQAQKAVPMAPPRLALPQGQPPAPGGGAPGGVTGAPPMGPAPGSFGPLHRPTERPLEPVTNGAALGPGAGPEVLPTANITKVSDVFAQAAQRLGSSQLQAMAGRAQAAGQ